MPYRALPLPLYRRPPPLPHRDRSYHYHLALHFRRAALPTAPHTRAPDRTGVGVVLWVCRQISTDGSAVRCWPPCCCCRRYSPPPALYSTFFSHRAFAFSLSLVLKRLQLSAIPDANTTASPPFACIRTCHVTMPLHMHFPSGLACRPASYRLACRPAFRFGAPPGSRTCSRTVLDGSINAKTFGPLDVTPVALWFIPDVAAVSGSL